MNSWRSPKVWTWLVFMWICAEFVFFIPLSMLAPRDMSSFQAAIFVGVWQLLSLSPIAWYGYDEYQREQRRLRRKQQGFQVVPKDGDEV